MSNNPKDGALNLLKNCLNVRSSETVLLVLEPNDSFYEASVASVFEDCLTELNVQFTKLKPPLISDPADFPTGVSNAMKEHDHTLFISRIGDYVRFTPMPGNSVPATSYTLTRQMLGSPYATVDNRLMQSLQHKLEDQLMHAKRWRIRCPLGTKLSGEFCWPSLSGGQDDNLTISLFPVATFKPIPCSNAHGQVALSRWLMPGGAAKLDKADMTIKGVVQAHVKDGYLNSFTGEQSQVDKLNKHYDYISQSLGINRNRIHSWHVGINPQTHFDRSADEHLDLWSAISFGSPKYLHFHTCGDTPPGEVAWSIFNPTITIDDTHYWENGEFVWLQQKNNKALIESYDCGRYLLEPSLPIGIT